MKLSELFRTPFKLKGGATLNLKGFSKRVIDKEVGEGGGSSEDSEIADFVSFLFNMVQSYPKPALFGKFIYNDDVISTEDIFYNRNYFFLYNSSFELDVDKIIIGFSVIPGNGIEIMYKEPNSLASTNITIDGKTYRYFKEVSH